MQAALLCKIAKVQNKRYNDVNKILFHTVKPVWINWEVSQW